MNKKIYFISGASSGIGEDITKELIEKGFTVIGCGLDLTANYKNNNFIYFKSDVADHKNLKENLHKVMLENNISTLNGVVTSAGICGVAEDIYNTSEERFAELFNINVMGTYNTIKACLKYLSNGSIVTISSSLGTKPVQKCIGYSPAKAAICQLTKNLALELSPNIRVNSV
ncbi:SDR family oxidoreductase, partial [Clostridium sp.]|uniref:SDR family oxidoreductase n=1 Tax=Clostridium sp. TaxID=1506 RepID=UPI003F413EF8